MCIFIFSFIFFSQIHPLVLFDGDDWTYIAVFRKPFPLWGSWNPSRVLPEVAMPLVGYVSAYFTNLFVHDYIYSITLTVAFILAVLLVFVYIIFIRYLESFKVIEHPVLYFLGIILIIANFGLFKSQGQNNVYMLSAVNLTCYFYYVIPSLLNSILVLYMCGCENIDDSFKNMHSLQKDVFIILAYFAIFSNVFNSAILAIFCFSNILYDSFNYKKKLFGNVRTIISDNKVSIYVVLSWVVSLIFEMRGGRAVFLGKSHSYFDLPIKETTLYFLSLLKLINHYWLALLIISICFAFISFLGKPKSLSINKKIKKDTIIFAISGLIIGVFLILVCAKAAPSYAKSIDCVYGFYFYLLMVFSLSVIYIITRFARLKLLLPIVSVIIFILATNSLQPFVETNFGNHLPSECKAIDENLIRQIQEADKNKEKTMVLNVPKGDDNDNWPHPMYMGKNISRALFAHGLISKNITIKIQPDISMNEKYYIK